MNVILLMTISQCLKVINSYEEAHTIMNHLMSIIRVVLSKNQTQLE